MLAASPTTRPNIAGRIPSSNIFRITCSRLAPSATQLAKEMELDAADPALLASVGEFLLEGLYVNNRLSKYNGRGKTFFKR